MEIKNAFDVPLPVEQAWTVLMDVPKIAPCMPGARLTEVLGDDRYAGEVAVRLGPVMLKFAGRAEIVAKDPAAKTARVKAEGSDQKGRGGAAANVQFAITPEGGGSRVSIITDLVLSGSVAQYGRGAGMISDLANHMVGQFAANLRRELDKLVVPAAASSAPQTATPPTAAPVSQAAEPAPIDAGRLGAFLLWRAVVRFFKRLFGQPA